MPSLTKKQHNFMQAAKHNPYFARKAGISQTVASEFIAADQKAGKFQKKKAHRKVKYGEF
jgi:hypothetical protein